MTNWEDFGQFLMVMGGLFVTGIAAMCAIGAGMWVRDSAQHVKEYAAWIQAGKPYRICNACQYSMQLKEEVAE